MNNSKLENKISKKFEEKLNNIDAELDRFIGDNEELQNKILSSQIPDEIVLGGLTSLLISQTVNEVISESFEQSESDVVILEIEQNGKQSIMQTIEMIEELSKDQQVKNEMLEAFLVAIENMEKPIQNLKYQFKLKHVGDGFFIGFSEKKFGKKAGLFHAQIAKGLKESFKILFRKQFNEIESKREKVNKQDNIDIESFIEELAKNLINSLLNKKICVQSNQEKLIKRITEARNIKMIIQKDRNKQLIEDREQIKELIVNEAKKSENQLLEEKINLKKQKILNKFN